VMGKQLSMPLHSDVAHPMDSGNSRCASSGLEHCVRVADGLRCSSCAECAPYGYKAGTNGATVSIEGLK
jgi:hypothetical protein